MLQVIKHKVLFLVIAAVSVTFSLAMIIFFGLKPGIDFTGGTIVEIKAPGVEQKIDTPSEWIRKTFTDEGADVGSVQKSGDDVYIVKTKEIDQKKWSAILSKLQEKYKDTKEQSFETIGPLLGAELLKKTFYAVVIATFMLLFYIAWRFEHRLYGITAVAAMIHDVLLILASFAVFGFLFNVEVDIMFVTATLTALAFSVHDTIVLYDRVREVERRHPKEKFADIVNLAINATIVRSVSTSLAIIFVLTSLLLLGGETIRWFVAALLVGTITGVYSSPFIAAPLVVVLRDWEKSRKKK